MLFQWLAKKRALVDWIFTIAQGVLMASGFALPAWAASASDWMNAWGPISWVAAGFAGLAVTIGLMWAVAAWRRFRITSNILEVTTRQGHAVNPLDDMFYRKRMYIAALTNPVRGEIRDKTFIECDLVGPANLIVFPDCTFHANGGELVDGLLFTRSTARAGFNIHNCTFRNCRFYNVTFLVPAVQYELFQRHGWNGLNWLTYHPYDPQGVEIEAEPNKEIDSKVPRQIPEPGGGSPDEPA